MFWKFERKFDFYCLTCLSVIVQTLEQHFSFSEQGTSLPC